MVLLVRMTARLAGVQVNSSLNAASILEVRGTAGTQEGSEHIIGVLLT